MPPGAAAIPPIRPGMGFFWPGRMLVFLGLP
jgi:hypothetical protein